jgi:hypothetical protein
MIRLLLNRLHLWPPLHPLKNTWREGGEIAGYEVHHTFELELHALVLVRFDGPGLDIFLELIQMRVQRLAGSYCNAISVRYVWKSWDVGDYDFGGGIYSGAFESIGYEDGLSGAHLWVLWA